MKMRDLKLGLNQYKQNFESFRLQYIDSKPLSWLILFLVTLMVFDIIVVSGVHVLKEIVGNCYLILAPGFLIMVLLKLDKLSFLKKSILIVGLSLSALMFTGLLINSLYPWIDKPLSFAWLITTFNLCMVALALMAFWINRDGFNPSTIFNFTLDLKDKLRSPLLFPLLFPLMAVLGTGIMNIWSNNLILLLMLFTISIYFVTIIHLSNERLHPSTYPLAIWMISLSLLLMHGLTSYHLMGNDIHNEFYSFQVTLNSYHWSISQYYSASNSVISVTILPMVFYVLSSVNPEYIFKLIYAIIGSLTPLTVYLITKRYLNPKYAFAGALFFIFQVAFIYNLLSSTKTLIAIFFFTMAMMLIFEEEIAELQKKIIFIVFLMATVLSHYTTSYIMAVLLLSVTVVFFSRKYDIGRRLGNFKQISISKNVWISKTVELFKTEASKKFRVSWDKTFKQRSSRKSKSFKSFSLPKELQLFKNWTFQGFKILKSGVVTGFKGDRISRRVGITDKFEIYDGLTVSVMGVSNQLKKQKETGISVSSHFFTLGLTVMFIAIIFLWYSQLTSSPASNTVEFITNSLHNVGNLFVQDLRTPTQNAVLGLGINKLPQLINIIVYDSIFAFIGLGIIFLTWKRNYKKISIEPEFIVMIITSTIILFSFVLFPYLSEGYGATRLFIQLAVFLALPFVIGVVTLANLIKRPKWDRMLLSVMLVLILACATYIPYHILGEPVSPDYDENGLIRNQTFISNMDMITAEWLNKYRVTQIIYSDRKGSYVLALALKQDPYTVSKTNIFSDNKTAAKGYIFLGSTNSKGSIYINDTMLNIKNYQNLFSGSNRIYDNGEGSISLYNRTIYSKKVTTKK